MDVPAGAPLRHRPGAGCVGAEAGLEAAVVALGVIAPATSVPGPTAVASPSAQPHREPVVVPTPDRLLRHPGTGTGLGTARYPALCSRVTSPAHTNPVPASTVHGSQGTPVSKSAPTARLPREIAMPEAVL